jgi:hypothetical protein
MKAALSLDEYNRIPVSRSIRHTAGIRKGQPLRAVAMPGRIIIERIPSGGNLVKKRGRLVWNGEIPEGVNSASAVNSLRDEI